MTALIESINQIVSLTKDEITAIEKAYNTIDISKGKLWIEHERYEKMIKENPEILLSVPLQYTASFLGIAPQYLSRLRKELIK
jgi:hypothetical protein